MTGCTVEESKKITESGKGPLVNSVCQKGWSSRLLDLDEEVLQGADKLKKPTKAGRESAYFSTHLQDCPLETGDPLAWWRQNSRNFPILSRLARKFLAIPATSASSERLFSTAGNILTSKRNSLGDDALSSMIFLRGIERDMKRFPGYFSNTVKKLYS